MRTFGGTMDLDRMNQHYSLVRDLHNMEEDRAGLEARAMKHSRIDGMPHGSGGTTQPTEVVGIALAELSQRIDEQKARIARSEIEIEEFITEIPDTMLSLAFRLRYESALPWKQIPDYCPRYMTADAAKAAVFGYIRKHG